MTTLIASTGQDELIIETGLTGPDWEPDESMRYYASVVDHVEFAFGATRAEALRNLALALKD